MRWKGRRGSENVEDRRSMRKPAMAGGGILGLLLVLLVVFLGGDPQPLMKQMQNNQQGQQGQRGQPGQRGQRGQRGQPEQVDPAQDELAQMVSVILADTEDVWTQLFRQQGNPYRKPTLVLFRDQIQSACGFQSAATGPFYCPPDEHVYIDLSFFEEMDRKLGAPGDFAQAYVVAHEVGHHVQKLMGISDKVHNLQRRASKEQGNEFSVRLELQADFFAGVWAHHAQRNWQILEEGDIEEALNAATAIGDDRLQKGARGYVVPESFTHGTSDQRMRWFYRGLKSGDMSQGDTFGMRYEEL
jgi:predicted metalloprotease